MTILSELQSQLNSVLTAARRGQRKGCQTCGVRPTSQDCAACNVANSLPSEGQLRASIELEQINIANSQNNIIIEEPINDIIQLQPKNNNLRNVLLIGGAFLLLG